MNELTSQYVLKCSYTDFIGIVNQTNVPPGAFTTLSEWIFASNIAERSHLIEVACTTGFSLREIARRTGCSGEGVDLNQRSIGRAISNLELVDPKPRIQFYHGDATVFRPQEAPSHVIVGAALGFFPNPEVMLEQIRTYFRNGRGQILASPFYCTSEIAPALLSEAKEQLGITPTRTNYKDTMSLFRGFRIGYEHRHSPIMETAEEIKHYCQSTVDRASLLAGNVREDVREAMFNRLFAIRDVTNRLRPHQGYSVLVLDYDQQEYGARYVELF